MVYIFVPSSTINTQKYICSASVISYFAKWIKIKYFFHIYYVSNR